MLVKLALNVDHRLANTTADDWSSATLVIDCVWRWVLTRGDRNDFVATTAVGDVAAT